MQPTATLTDDGLVFRLQDPALVPVSHWAAQSQVGSGAGILLCLREEETATDVHGDGLLVPWTAVAQLSEAELRDLGLPDPAPFALEVRADGAIHSPGFAVHYSFVHQGRRILGAKRQGAWLTVADQHYILLNPVYSVVEAIAGYENATGDDVEKRMLHWGEIAAQLPPETIQDGHLRELRFVVASAFEIDPFVNGADEPDLDPVPGRNTTKVNELGEVETTFESLLPEARQRDFVRRFRGLQSVRSRYTLPGNTFVVLTPAVRAALGTVREYQKATPAERRAYLENPSGEIRRALDLDGREDVEVDDVFSEGDLSERVTGTGLWEPKVLPWVERPGQPWLPPDSYGLVVDGEQIQLEPEDLEPLREAILEARATEKRELSYNGHRIPANDATLAAISLLQENANARTSDEASPDENASGVGRPDETENTSRDQVLLILDNLASVNFRRTRQDRFALPAMEASWLKSSLLPHQEEGVAWLRHHWEAGTWGALLADDMGLGKTFCALAFLRLVREGLRTDDSVRGPALVVAPTGLLKNWEDEHDQRLGGSGLGALVRAHGRGLRALRARQDRSWQREKAMGEPLLNLARLEAADCVLTTYETLRDHQHSFGRIQWCAGVFDEAQKIKNPGARLTEAVLAMNLDFVLLMTGTPVENRPADIWSLLDRAEPGLFGTLKDFSALYESQMEPTEETPSALDDLNTRLTHPMGEGEPALMLRRLKEDYLPSLPNKNVYYHTDDMPDPQANAYEGVVNEARGQSDMGILAVLSELRRISLHPLRYLEGDLEQYVEQSARLIRCFSILEEVRQMGEKALVFVESRDIQAFLMIALRQRFGLPADVLLINGTVTGDDRKRRVDDFQERDGFDVMVLSPRAGGVGLTLTQANHVIHLSRWWNPAVEDQCTDRVFRIGQARPVHIHLPMARHPVFDDFSFDLRLNQLMNTKRDRNRRVLAPLSFSTEDMSGLFRATVEDAAQAAGD